MSNASFISFYSDLEASAQRGVYAIFQRNQGEYYTVHGETALFVADQYYKTRDVLKYYEEQKLPGLSIRPNKLGPMAVIVGTCFNELFCV